MKRRKDYVVKRRQAIFETLMKGPRHRFTKICKYKNKMLKKRLRVLAYNKGLT